MKAIALTAKHQQILDSFLWEALWDPPCGPRRSKDVLLNPNVRAYVDAWTNRPDDLGFALETDNQEILGVVWSRLLLPPYGGGAFYDDRTPQLGNRCCGRPPGNRAG